MSEMPAGLSEALADRYAIEREVGRGGMATVYRARDLRHDRPVALKVLLPQLAATLGPDRFLREVSIAAKLQHPNILPLYDSGEAGGFLYYVMPFVEGQSLRQRLSAEGELPVGDAARILRDVADALAAAHAAGVVHRDIKPENIMLSGRHALVADFGVAKAVSEATGRQALTTTGVALGTPVYMAPEQASADPHTDHRADLYALGVTAFEMLTGRPPFVGLTAQAVLAAHMTEAPPPVTGLRPTIPPPLAQLVMRCLEKKPADRPQSAEELIPVLESATTPSAGLTPAETQPVQAPAAPAKGRLAVWGVAIAVVAVAIGLFATPLFRHRPLDLTVSDITQVTSAPGVEYQPAISPDGKAVAYVAGRMNRGHLVIRSAVNVTGGGEIRLSDTSLVRVLFPSWSSDGEFVRFAACRTGGCRWAEIGKLGGAVRPPRLPNKARSRRGAWSPDDTRMAFVVRDTIFAATVGDTAVRVLAVHTASYWSLHSLAWSPDAKTIAYVNGNPGWLNSGNVAVSSLWIVAADGGEPKPLFDDDFLNVSPAWLDASHLLFVSNRDGPRGLYVVEVDRNGARGEPRIIPGVSDPHSVSYSIASHTLAFAKFTLRQNVWAYPLRGSAPVSIADGRPVTSGTQVIEEHDVSPDGRWLVFDSNRRGNMDLYKMPLGGGEAVPLTDLPDDEFGPRWSPDGSEILFYYHHAYPDCPDGIAQIMVMPATGGTPARLTCAAGFNNFARWSPSGLDIAFYSSGTGWNHVSMLSRDRVGGAWHDAVQLTPDGTFPLGWAPDGSGVVVYKPTSPAVLPIVGRDGQVVGRYDLAAAGMQRMTSLVVNYSTDGRTLFLGGVDPAGNQGIWALPVSGGAARLLIAFDDPAILPHRSGKSIGPDALYLTVSQYDSDIWVAKLERP